MNIDTGEIRKLAIGEEPTDREILLDEQEAELMSKIEQRLRLDAYNELVETRQVRRAKARAAKKPRNLHHGR